MLKTTDNDLPGFLQGGGEMGELIRTFNWSKPHLEALTRGPKVLLRRELVVLPDFVFIDINMPGITGDKCLKALRREKEFENMVIALYSTSMPETVADALKSAGANFVFEKPVRLKGYVEILTRIIVSDSA